MMHLLAGGVPFDPTAFVGVGILGLFLSILVFALIVVILALKGYALWYAAKRDEKWWFVVMLIINTAGILELCYLVFVVKKWPKMFTDRMNGSSSSSSSKPADVDVAK